MTRFVKTQKYGHTSPYIEVLSSSFKNSTL